jgi:hypothetical protein
MHGLTVVFKGCENDLSVVKARVYHYRQPLTPLTPLTTNIKHPEWCFKLEFYLLDSSCFLAAMENVLE